MTQIGEGVFAPVPPKEKGEKDDDGKEKISIRLLLFFDGTLNNRTNVDERLENTDLYQELKGEGSYNNDPSNIARLERYVDRKAEVEGVDHVVSVYTEGAGTENLGEDALLGSSIGVHTTGIDAKVQKGIEEAVAKTSRLVSHPSKYIVEKTSIDLFGFSRGAASARYCIHKLFDEGGEPLSERLEAKGFEMGDIEVNLVGLFDTVSSHGLSFGNDVSALKLDAIHRARQVIQLAAAEEYRAKFSLTNIKSSGGKGREIFLPGAHSDVGGGYTEGEEKQVVLIRPSSAVARDKRWLISQGWYKERELSEITLGIKSASVDVGLKAHRPFVGNAYSKIPLKIMAQFCSQEGIKLRGDFSKEISLSGESTNLQELEKVLMSHVSSGRPSNAEDWQADYPMLKEVRNRYLHMSARYEVGMHPRIRNGLRKRKTYDG